ncbi:MAG TPA: CvpA family protein [Anaerolineae bacterium]|nr:CvpA family protein [Anaerolineae bacterium]HQI83074.1 CvpA family protein [Anaerolineae bacterium]
MTILDGLLILIGAALIVLCAMEGLLRTLMMLLSFYIATTVAGMITLATNTLHGVTVALIRATGGSSAPNMTIAETVTFVGFAVPLFVGAYFLSKMAFPDTAIPKLHALDNIFGLLVGVVLAFVVMAVFYNTWGVAVSVRWRDPQLWNQMRYAYFGAFLRPYMHQALAYYRPALFLFSLLRYPAFFLPQ